MIIQHILHKWVRLLLIVVSFFLSVGVQANDNEAIKRAFMDLHIVLQDIPGLGGIPLGNTDWRIVKGEDEWYALGNKDFMMQGKTNSKGEVILSNQELKKLFAAWQRAPDQLWFVFNSKPSNFVPQQINGAYEISLLAPESDLERKMREDKEKNQLAAETPLPLSSYTQPGFDAKPFVADYEIWRGKFKADLQAFNNKLQASPQYGRSILEDQKGDELKQLFSRSLHSGYKGMSLRKELVAAQYVSPATEGTEISPAGDVLTKLLLSEHAKPVGYGGTFIDEGNTVELWYMVFDDMTEWTLLEFNESLVFSAFSAPKLPAYKVTQRNSWPALVFVRDEDATLKLYGISKEMASILQNIFNAQVF
jgi:hypothetical protein